MCCKIITLIILIAIAAAAASYKMGHISGVVDEHDRKMED